MGRRIHLITHSLVALGLCISYLAVLCVPLTAQPIVAATSTHLSSARVAVAPDCSSTGTAEKISTDHSWLIVILDRSGSLGGSSGTDPSDYSASVTRLLATLWNGTMEVIILSGDATPLKTLGPYDLSSANPSQASNRNALKQAIEGYREQFGGDTPTQQAVEQAYQQLARENFPAGSEVMMLTDGQPDTAQDPGGTAQIRTIEQIDAPKFLQAGVAINTFGLQTNSIPGAKDFLQTVAQKTNGCSYEVDNAKDLAGPVVQLYARWQGLRFLQADHNTFKIDTYASTVDFITFLKNNQPGSVQLIGPNQKTVPDGAFQGTDQDPHYQFNSLDTKGFSDAGTYTINHQQDPDALAYALVETGLRLEIVAPTSHTPAYTGQPVTVNAAFYNDGDNPLIHAHPAPGDVTSIVASYTVTANGTIVEGGTVPLTQQPAPHDDLFSAQITPSHTGTLTITINAKYQYIQVPNTASVTLKVLPPPVVPPAPQPLCHAGDYKCYVQHYGIYGLIVLVALLLLLLLLRPRPFGMMIDSSRDRYALAQGRTLLTKVLNPSRLKSSKIPIEWDDASFVLHFKRGKRVFLKALEDAPAITIKRAASGETVSAPRGTAVPLENTDRILVNGKAKATFHQVVDLG